MNISLTAKKRALALIFTIMLMDIIGLSILFPVSAYIVQQYSSDVLMITMMTVIYSAAQFFATPLLGKLSDRYGRRPVLLWSVVGSSIGYVIFGVGGALWVLFLSRLIDGFTGGNMSTASAYIADVSKPEERARNFSLVGLAWGIGLVVGPALGAVLGQLNLAAPAYFAAIVSFASAVLGFFWLPESLPPEQRTTAPLRISDLNSFAAIGEMACRPGLGRLFVVLCLFNFAFNGIVSTETPFMIGKFAAEPWQVGLRLVLLGIALAAIQRRFVPWLFSKYSAKQVAIAAFVIQAVGLAVAFFVPDFWMFFLLSTFTGLVSGLIFPTTTTLTVERVSRNEQGQLMGVTTALASLMAVLGPLYGGLVYDHVMPGSPYWMGAIVYAVAVLVLLPAASGNAHQPAENAVPGH